MELQTVQCSQCGAPLPIADATRFVTCAYCRARLAIRRTAAALFTEQLQDVALQARALAADVRFLQLERDLEALDAGWKREQEQIEKECSPHEPWLILLTASALPGILLLAWWSDLSLEWILFGGVACLFLPVVFKAGCDAAYQERLKSEALAAHNTNRLLLLTERDAARRSIPPQTDSVDSLWIAT